MMSNIETHFNTSRDPFVPLPYLPLEIWELILLDSFNLKARKHYLEAKEITLFSELREDIGLLLKDRRTTYEFQKVFPLLIGWLQKEDILKCRLVCKRWYSSIVEYLEAETWRTDSLEKYYDEPPNSSYIEKKIECKLSSIRKNYQLVANLPKYQIINPITAGRRLTIESFQFRSVSDFDEFIESVCTVLEKVGHFIWHVKWIPKTDYLTCTQLLRGLFSCLQLLPNIRRLEVGCAVIERRNPKFIRNDIAWFEKNNPPHLQSLRSLLLNVNGLPYEIETALLSCLGKSVHQLKYTLFKTYIFDAQKYFKNLVDLQLVEIGNLSYLESVMTGMSLLNISLQSFTGFFDCEFNLTELLVSFRGFKTLKVIKIQGTGVHCAPLDSLRNERHSGIHTFEIVDTRHLNYTFINLLPSLSYLTIEMSRKSTEKNECNHEREEIGGHTHDIIMQCLHKNCHPPLEFWKKYPNLKKILVVHKEMDENGWEVNHTVLKCFPRFR